AAIDFARSFKSPTFVRGWSGFVSMSSTPIHLPSDAPNRSESDSTKWESWCMRASTGSPRFLLDTGKHLLRQGVVLRGSRGARREGEDRLAVGRTLLQPDALGDRRLEDAVPEDRGNLVEDVLADDRPLVVQSDHDAEDSQRRVGPGLDL